MKKLSLTDFRYLIQRLFKNKDSLDKISESDDGDLLYNGESILNDLIISNKKTYSSNKIEARFEEVQSNITSGQGSGANILQKTYLNKIANDSLYISTTDEFTLNKCIVQLYKFIPGNQDIVEVLKNFNNTNAESFYYNTEVVEFRGTMKIKDTTTIISTLNEDGIYETPIINKADFLNIEGIE